MSQRVLITGSSRGFGRLIAETHRATGFPRAVSYTNAKVVTRSLREVIQHFHGAGLLAVAPVSMQTLDEQTLENIDRTNIKTSEYRKLIAFLREREIPTSSDMMLGLPGQTFETCRRDLQFFFDHRVLAVHHQTSVMPNAPMAAPEYRQRFGLEVGEDGLVAASYSFDATEYARMLDLCLAYKLFVKNGLLRYLLYFLQLEHEVPAMDLLARWVERTGVPDEDYPRSRRIRQDLLNIDRDRVGGSDWLMLGWDDEAAAFLFEDYRAFLEEVLEFARREFGAEPGGAALEAVLVANEAVMRRKGRAFPLRLPLPADVPGFFRELWRAGNMAEVPALSSRGPGVLELPAQEACTSYAYVDGTPGVGRWELASNLRARVPG